MPWGRSIKEIRRRHGLTQKMMAELLNVDITSVSRWERGEVVPGLRARRTIQELLRADAFDLTFVPIIDQIEKPAVIQGLDHISYACSRSMAEHHKVTPAELTRVDLSKWFTPWIWEAHRICKEAGGFESHVQFADVTLEWKHFGKTGWQQCRWTRFVYDGTPYILVTVDPVAERPAEQISIVTFDDIVQK